MSILGVTLMRMLRSFVLGALLVSGSVHARPDQEDDWDIFGKVLSLVQSIVHSAARSDDPRMIDRRIESIVSGEDARANGIARDIMRDTFDDFPREHRETAITLGKDLIALARRDRARDDYGNVQGVDAALRARKDLAAIGFRYYDASQFLEAATRDDALAVELFINARGVDLEAKDATGLTALQLAQRRGNRRVVALLEAARR